MAYLYFSFSKLRRKNRWRHFVWMIYHVQNTLFKKYAYSQGDITHWLQSENLDNGHCRVDINKWKLLQHRKGWIHQPSRKWLLSNMLLTINLKHWKNVFVSTRVLRLPEKDLRKGLELASMIGMKCFCVPRLKIQLLPFTGSHHRKMVSASLHKVTSNHF